MNRTAPSAPATGRTGSIRCRLPGRQLLLASSAVLLAAAGLAACGGSKSASQGAAATPSASRSGSRQGGAAPAAFGLAAAISGNTVEVQDPATGQVSVTFSARTAFSQTRTVTRAAIAVGSCVSAIAQRAASAASASPAPAAGPVTSFQAGSVSISAAVNGSCAVAGFGGGRASGGGRPSNFPSGRPTGARSSGGGGGIGNNFGAIANGKVSQLTGDTMLVQVTGRGGQAGSVDTVTLTPSTSYTETAGASSAALKVGECVTATGTADQTGTVAATRIALSTAGPNGCTAGFGRRPQQASAANTGA